VHVQAELGFAANEVNDPFEFYWILELCYAFIKMVAICFIPVNAGKMMQSLKKTLYKIINKKEYQTTWDWVKSRLGAYTNPNSQMGFYHDCKSP